MSDRALIHRVGAATLRLRAARAAATSAQAEQEAAEKELSAAWGELRDYQDGQVEAELQYRARWTTIAARAAPTS